jgi:DNA-binding CsgD family transcriptional regulator
MADIQETMQLDSEDRLRLLLAVVLGVILVAGIADLVLDQPESWTSPHVLFEVTIILGALATTFVLWWGWWRSTRSVSELSRSLEERERERDAWRRSAEQALEGLGRAIDTQFDGWGLTPSEREVALLLLNGHSHKAIARRTDRSAQTVRQHATAVYAKADLAGRAELSAFFLEDLMLPEVSGEAQGDR